MLCSDLFARIPRGAEELRQYIDAVAVDDSLCSEMARFVLQRWPSAAVFDLCLGLVDHLQTKGKVFLWTSLMQSLTHNRHSDFQMIGIVLKRVLTLEIVAEPAELVKGLRFLSDDIAFQMPLAFIDTLFEASKTEIPLLANATAELLCFCHGEGCQRWFLLIDGMKLPPEDECRVLEALEDAPNFAWNNRQTRLYVLFCLARGFECRWSRKEMPPMVKCIRHRRMESIRRLLLLQAQKDANGVWDELCEAVIEAHPDVVNLVVSHILVNGIALAKKLHPSRIGLAKRLLASQADIASYVARVVIPMAADKPEAIAALIRNFAVKDEDLIELARDARMFKSVIDAIDNTVLLARIVGEHPEEAACHALVRLVALNENTWIDLVRGCDLPEVAIVAGSGSTVDAQIVDAMRQCDGSVEGFKRVSNLVSQRGAVPWPRIVPAGAIMAFLTLVAKAGLARRMLGTIEWAVDLLLNASSWMSESDSNFIELVRSIEDPTLVRKLVRLAQRNGESIEVVQEWHCEHPELFALVPHLDPLVTRTLLRGNHTGELIGYLKRCGAPEAVWLEVLAQGKANRMLTTAVLGHIESTNGFKVVLGLPGADIDPLALFRSLLRFYSHLPAVVDWREALVDLPIAYGPFLLETDDAADDLKKEKKKAKTVPAAKRHGELQRVQDTLKSKVESLWRRLSHSDPAMHSRLLDKPA